MKRGVHGHGRSSLTGRGSQDQEIRKEAREAHSVEMGRAKPASVDDDELVERVRHSFSHHKDIDVRHVIVAAQDQEVFLRGECDSTEDYHQIEEITYGVPGVRGVNNQMAVNRRI